MSAAVGKRYTEDEMTRGMLVLALNGGSVTKAKRQLAGEGFPVGDKTLTRWKDSPRYLAVRETHARKVEEGLVDNYRAVAVRSIELQMKATEQAIGEADAKTLKDPGRTAQSAAVAGGIAVDKVLLLTDRPTEILAHHADPKVAAQALARRLGVVLPSVESTAEEITELEATSG
jgi:hypothetical protein